MRRARHRARRRAAPGISQRRIRERRIAQRRLHAGRCRRRRARRRCACWQGPVGGHGGQHIAPAPQPDSCSGALGMGGRVTALVAWL